MRRSTRGQIQQRPGVVLIVVLVLVVMIALAGFGFANFMTTELEATRIAGDELQAEQTLRSAESYVQQIVGLTPNQREQLGGVTTNPALFRGVSIRVPDEAELDAGPDSVPGWQFSVVSGTPVADSLSDLEQPTPLNFGLDDESRKLHLAALLEWDRQQPGVGRGVLMRLPGMTEQIADAILDWVDSDRQPREFGAESEYYSALPRPMVVPNRVPESLDMLLAVRGVTTRLLFGDDADRNFEVDSNEGPAAADDLDYGLPQTSMVSDVTALSGGWADALTVSSGERNTTRDGRPRVYLNDNDLRRLADGLSFALPEDLSNFVILYRQFGPSLSAPGTTADVVTLDLNVPARVNIQSAAELVNAVVTLRGSPPTHVRSPLQTDDPGLIEQLTLLLDETTPTQARIITGRVDITRASEALVRAMPVFSEETAERIIAARRTLSPDKRLSTAWLLSDRLLSSSTYAQIEPWLTGGGDVFSCQLIVFRSSGGPIRRVHAIFDGAGARSRRVQWTDLRRFGLGFRRSSISRAGPETELLSSPSDFTLR